ncbi:MAG: sulfatase [Bryobacteraceae bacterium]
MRTTRRNFASAASAAALGGGFTSAAPASRPNVLVLHCHDLGQHLHCYGTAAVQTPNLDRFAARGVLFERSFCSQPGCSPSRSSIFTGRYPHSNGVMGLTHADFAWDLYEKERHLGQILKDAGYATAGVGVIHETRSGPRRCGLDDYSPGAQARAVADATIEKLRQFAANPGRPFYMQAGSSEPHRRAPADPRGDVHFTMPGLQPDDPAGVAVPPYLQDTPGTRAELAEMEALIHHMDEQMGRILKAVEDLDLEKNTLVIFTTDHGIAMPRAKCSVYEPGVRVTLLLRMAGRQGWQGGIRRREMISNVDYVPTILELLGVPAPENLQGRSFAPLLDGRPYTPRDAVFSELTYHNYYDPCRSVRTETHRLIVNFSAAPSFMDPSQSWRPRSDTVVPPNPARAYHPLIELYDLQNDPWERKNLAGEKAYADVLKALRARLWKHLESTADPILQGAVTSPMHRNATAWLTSA